MDNNISNLLNKIVNNYYIIEQIYHYLHNTYKSDHVDKYNSVLMQLHLFTRNLKAAFNELSYDKHETNSRISKFGIEWDLCNSTYRAFRWSKFSPK
jgi:hypothetical protein